MEGETTTNILKQLLEIRALLWDGRALLWDGCANILIKDVVEKLEKLIEQVRDDIT